MKMNSEINEGKCESGCWRCCYCADFQRKRKPSRGSRFPQPDKSTRGRTCIHTQSYHVRVSREERKKKKKQMREVVE